MTRTIAADDGLWERVEALILAKPRRFRNPGRKWLDDWQAVNGMILFVLHTGIACRHLPWEPAYGSGVTFWRWLCERVAGDRGLDPGDEAAQRTARWRHADRAQIVDGDIDLLIFFWHPLTA